MNNGKTEINLRSILKYSNYDLSLFSSAAKRGVEMAIEKGEKEAESWIDAKLQKLGIGF